MSCVFLLLAAEVPLGPNVLLVAIIAAFLVSLAMRSDPAMVFAWLAALGAVAFGGALAWFSGRG